MTRASLTLGIGLLASVIASGLVTLWPNAVSANCTPGQLSIYSPWPSGELVGVPTNARLLYRVQGPAVDEAVGHLSLYTDQGVELPLDAVYDLTSGRRMRQRAVWLAPRGPLAPNTHYTWYIVEHDRSVAHGFTTGPGPDRETPRLTGFTPGAFRSVAYGCGPGHSLPIRVDGLRDDPELEGGLWVRLRVFKDTAHVARGSALGELVEPVRDGAIEFGHGMCVGNWDLDPGQTYVARASVIDSGFNETKVSAPFVLDAR